MLEVAALIAMFGAAQANAQRPVTFSIAGGASLPAGRLGDVTSTGWHALASIAVSTLMQPIGLRLDLAHNQFASNDLGPDRAVSSGTLNLTYRLPLTNSPLSPYLIAGGGAYMFDCISTANCSSDETDFGWNAGLGTKFAALGLRGFLEARFHAMNMTAGNVRFVPLTFGLTF
jgi:hypothetical protein